MNNNRSFFESIRILDFFVQLFKRKNIPALLYIVLNIIVISFFGWGLIPSLIIYVVCLCIALSPIGEWLLRKETGCKDISDPIINARLQPLFEEVYGRAKAYNPSIPSNIKLFINDEEDLNAFATGKKTICINRGLLSSSDEEIKAVLAHEFGHLSNKDTELTLVVYVGNQIFTWIMILYRSLVGLCNSIYGGFTGLIINLFTLFISLIIAIIMKAWIWVGIFMVRATSRAAEYEADAFAKQLGYVDGLISFFHSIDSSNYHSQGVFAALSSTHPKTCDRIEQLRHDTKYSGSAIDTLWMENTSKKDRSSTVTASSNNIKGNNKIDIIIPYGIILLIFLIGFSLGALSAKEGLKLYGKSFNQDSSIEAEKDIGQSEEPEQTEKYGYIIGEMYTINSSNSSNPLILRSHPTSSPKSDDEEGIIQYEEAVSDDEFDFSESEDLIGEYGNNACLNQGAVVQVKALKHTGDYVWALIDKTDENQYWIAALKYYSGTDDIEIRYIQN